MIVEQLKSEKLSLEKAIATLEPLRKRHALIIELLRSYGEQEEQPQLIAVAPGVNGSRYGSLAMMDAIRTVLGLRPTEFLTPREITKHLLEGGFKTASPNLKVMVGEACKRKSKGASAEFEAGEKDKYKAYRLK